MGCGTAGFYAYDLVDNGGYPSANSDVVLCVPRSKPHLDSKDQPVAPQGAWAERGAE